jgi:hypothetical protein
VGPVVSIGWTGRQARQAAGREDSRYGGEAAEDKRKLNMFWFGRKRKWEG